ncbi:MAG: ArgE/DapE family deacylase [Limosilactobacillus sp.]|uniref:ArgE/DapE family deacylase n=1 Tax=Limosilactobacillus sp. TaxID=2773925 RepID=UPI00270544BB|nr:ArgE/DapE family deacylase [Limosilactobacillus sp.]
METSEKVKILQDLIKIHSVNGNESEVADYLEALFDKYGVKTDVDHFSNRRSNLIATIGKGKSDKVLGLTGHMDTVAVTNPDTWQHDPFGGEIVGGEKLYGRGAADMKSGLAAQAIALIELSESKSLPKGTVKFIATAGEELGTPGAHLLEKQGVSKDLDALVVGEPTGGNVIFSHSGSMNYVITSSGKSTHSSHPSHGINAITGLLKYVEKEEHLFDDAPKDKYLGKIQHSVTVIEGGDQVNTIPDHALLKGNVRPTPSFDNQKVADLLNKVVDEINVKYPYHLKLTIIQDYHPIFTDPDSKFVKTALDASKKYFPHDVKTDIINGATDASVFTSHRPDLPAVVLGCDFWDEAHQTDEYTTISSYLATVDVYKKIIKEFFD